MNEIFVSSSNIRARKLKDSVQRLAELGFKNIELSGGSAPYPELIPSLLELRDRYGLVYRCHNYFPPPETPFVLNLASDDERTLEQSRNLVRKAIDLSKEFGSTKYGVHAGFRINPRVSELGSKIPMRSLSDYNNAVGRFATELGQLNEYGRVRGVDLYVENNVFSQSNLRSFRGDNPFLLTQSAEVRELRDLVDFKLLLDVAHLKVSCQSIGSDFAVEYLSLIDQSDYIHISDNDGTEDSNCGLIPDTALYEFLKSSQLDGKTFTLEIYGSEGAMQDTFEVLSNLISNSETASTST